MKYFTLLLFVLASLVGHSQNADNPIEIDSSQFKIMFYNVENLFDTINNPETNDEDFTPNGTRLWDTYKYYKKINQISKVIKAVGKWNPPAIVGLAEIENVNVLNALAIAPALRKFGYRYVHQDSKDKRGIEVALLYKPSQFEPLFYQAIPIVFKTEKEKILRDILYVKGIAGGKDTLSFFVNHWSSRLGGVLESEPYRMFAAQCLRHFTDSLIKQNPREKLIIMGDFNDYPNNKSLCEYLGAQIDSAKIRHSQLINLAAKYKYFENIGTHKVNGTWGCLDQMIVSNGLYFPQSGYYTNYDNFSIFREDFLLMDDEVNLGKKPFRTYNGFVYQGGFSDHLPVYIDLELKK